MRTEQAIAIDKHVGARLRARRMLLGITQEALALQADITFQQIQKYEKGSNRIAASRLAQFCEVLNTNAGYFFEGAPSATADGSCGKSDKQEGVFEQTLASISSTDGLMLNRSFAQVTNPRVRKRIVDLVVAIANESDAEEPVEQSALAA